MLILAMCGITGVQELTYSVSGTSRARFALPNKTECFDRGKDCDCRLECHELVEFKRVMSLANAPSIKFASVKQRLLQAGKHINSWVQELTDH